MYVSNFMNSSDAGQKLFHKTSWRMLWKWAVSDDVIEQFTAVQGLKYLAVSGSARERLTLDDGLRRSVV